MPLNKSSDSKEMYIIVKNNNYIPVSIKYARIIKFNTGSSVEDSSVTVEILGLMWDKSIFHIGEIYEMDMWDFNDNYERINKIDLLTKVL